MIVWVCIITFWFFDQSRSSPDAAMSAVVIDNLASNEDCQRIAQVANRNNQAGVSAECVQVRKARP